MHQIAPVSCIEKRPEQMVGALCFIAVSNNEGLQFAFVKVFLEIQDLLHVAAGFAFRVLRG
ncbi:hypothetical protein GCM10007086_38040 [Photobacterium aphoticum]|nr:hypothetical protein GCM10007086_38040 [Photobacterium aphoticum]